MTEKEPLGSSSRLYPWHGKAIRDGGGFRRNRKAWFGRRIPRMATNVSDPGKAKGGVKFQFNSRIRQRSSGCMSVKIKTAKVSEH